MKAKVAIAQIRTVTGDLEGNSGRIVAGIKRAVEEKADIVLFPETAITGYCTGALLTHNHFISYNLEFLEKKILPEVPKNLVAIVGFVDRNGTRLGGNPEIFNSCAVIQNGKIVGTYNKIHLADGGHHDDKHFFTAGDFPRVFDVEIQGESLKIGVGICEDFWAPKDHYRNVVKEAVDAGAKILFSPNQSYFYYGKKWLRKKIFGGHAKSEKIPVFFSNNISVGDILKNIVIYPGESCGFDAAGNVIVECDSFREDFKSVEISLSGNDEQSDFIQHASQYEAHQITEEEKYQELFDALIFAIPETISCMGLKRAMVAMSGGIDSALTATLVGLSMPKDDAILVSLPNSDNGEQTKSNAQHTADVLGVELHWVSMQEPYDGFNKSFEKAFGKEASNMSKSAFAAIGRTAMAIGLCHRFGNVGIVSTNNFSENILGFSSFHDLGNAGAFAPLSDLGKPELVKLSEFINNKFGKEYIPKNLYDGRVKPSAELADNKGDDPFIYEIVSGICSMLVRKGKSIQQIIDAFKNRELDKDDFPNTRDGKTIYEITTAEEFENQVRRCFELSKKSVFKCAQSSPGFILHPISRGFSTRETIINAYNGEYKIEAPTKPLDMEVRKLRVKVSS